MDIPKREFKLGKWKWGSAKGFSHSKKRRNRNRNHRRYSWGILRTGLVRDSCSATNYHYDNSFVHYNNSDNNLCKRGKWHNNGQRRSLPILSSHSSKRSVQRPAFWKLHRQRWKRQRYHCARTRPNYLYKLAKWTSGFHLL